MIKEATYTERGVRRRECLTCAAVQEQYAPDPKLTDEQTRDAILALINEERKKAGLAALGYLTEAQTAADIRATEVRNGFCDIRANGTEGITVLQEQGIPYQNAGEIWAVVDGTHAPRTIVRNAWMSSEKYQKTILDPNFKSMAVGIKDNGWIVFFVG